MQGEWKEWGNHVLIELRNIAEDQKTMSVAMAKDSETLRNLVTKTETLDKAVIKVNSRVDPLAEDYKNRRLSKERWKVIGKGLAALLGLLGTALGILYSLVTLKGVL